MQNLSLTEQMIELVKLANKNNLPDAADYLLNHLNTYFPKQVEQTKEERSKDSELEKQIDKAWDLKDKNKYISIWSIYEVVNRMNDIAAQAIRQSLDKHHIFIEAVEVAPNGELYLRTGS